MDCFNHKFLWIWFCYKFDFVTYFCSIEVAKSRTDCVSVNQNLQKISWFWMEFSLLWDILWITPILPSGEALKLIQKSNFEMI